MAAEKKEKAIINPFDKGVSYEDVLKFAGDKAIKDAFKGILTDDKIEWLTEEIENYKLTKKEK